MAMQINRRLHSAGAPTTLQLGQLSWNDPGTVDTPVANDTTLYIGSEDSSSAAIVRTVVGSTRQVELTGAQTITGLKTIAIANLHITGATANQILTATDATGALHWTNAPSGGLTTVATDGATLQGDGTSGAVLAVVKLPTPRDITIQTAAAAGNGAITTITATAASFDGSANGVITGFSISRLDDGTY